MVELAESEREILLIGRDLMSRLVASDDWLPAVFASPDENRCRHYQLYRDDLDRFSVVGTVLWTGQAMQIRQDKVWEIFGVLRGSVSRSLPPQAEGSGKAKVYHPGSVDAEASTNGRSAVHLSNALGEGVSIGIHVYGGDIGAITRSAHHADGAAGEMISDYANGENAPAYDIHSIQTEILD